MHQDLDVAVNACTKFQFKILDQGVEFDAMLYQICWPYTAYE